MDNQIEIKRRYIYSLYRNIDISILNIIYIYNIYIYIIYIYISQQWLQESGLLWWHSKCSDVKR